ncbi:MAG: hypothetical protein Q9174_000341 [Haloplaca sp. 1 TL-2023]
MACGPSTNTESASTTPSHTDVSHLFDVQPRPNGADCYTSDESGSSSQLEENINGKPSPHKKKILKLSRKTKKVTKRFFSNSNGRPGDGATPQDSKSATSILEQDPAFNLQRFDTVHQSEKGIVKKLQVNLQAVTAGIVHPKDGIKSKAARSTAGRLSKIDRPYVSRKMDRELLDAHDNYSRAQSVASLGKVSSEDAADLSSRDCRGRVDELESQRESRRAAYTTTRFVQRVRVVPKRHISFPESTDVAAADNQDVDAGVDRFRWLGHLLLWHSQDFSAQYIDDFDDLPFDRDSLQLHIERLISASAPWQEFFMSIRSVYRWEKPRNTAKWLAVYVVLWYYQYLISFVYCYIIYAVVRNRWFPTSIEALRGSMHRAHDESAQAYKFGELVDKHGRNHWLEPLLQDLGPFIQLQVNDVANMFEVFSNFHHWLYPRKTLATLTFLASCLMIGLSTDMTFCIKIATFIVGGAFFLCWPIASRYPKYRYLVSPFKWVLWDIPTDAEWSFQYLRRHAQTTREDKIRAAISLKTQSQSVQKAPSKGSSLAQAVPNILVNATEQEPSSGSDEEYLSTSSATSVLNEADITSYRAYSQGFVGRLVIYAGGVRFIRSLKRKELWRRPFIEMVEMRKKESSTVSKISTLAPHSLELKFIDSSKLLLDGMKDRDSAFNAIIGFSSLQWQSLQPKTGPACD